MNGDSELKETKLNLAEKAKSRAPHIFDGLSREDILVGEKLAEEIVGGGELMPAALTAAWMNLSVMLRYSGLVQNMQTASMPPNAMAIARRINQLFSEIESQLSELQRLKDVVRVAEEIVFEHESSRAHAKHAEGGER
jgi:hypothetical protein